MNLDKLIGLLLVEKRDTPSNYVLLVISEGARWERLLSAGIWRPGRLRTSQEDERRRGAGDGDRQAHQGRSIVSDLTYDLRSGEPDFVDKMIATTFGNMAIETVLGGHSGLMAALVDGCYTMVPIPDPKLGPRHVDVASMYNTDRYRPNYSHKYGIPIFLTRA